MRSTNDHSLCMDERKHVPSVANLEHKSPATVSGSAVKTLQSSEQLFWSVRAVLDRSPLKHGSGPRPLDGGPLRGAVEGGRGTPSDRRSRVRTRALDQPQGVRRRGVRVRARRPGRSPQRMASRPRARGRDRVGHGADLRERLAVPDMSGPPERGRRRRRWLRERLLSERDGWLQLPHDARRAARVRRARRLRAASRPGGPLRGQLPPARRVPAAGIHATRTSGRSGLSRWLGYVEDDPTNGQQPANVYLRGGGQETYTNYNTTTTHLRLQHQEPGPARQDGRLSRRVRAPPSGRDRRGLRTAERGAHLPAQGIPHADDRPAGPIACSSPTTRA